VGEVSRKTWAAFCSGLNSHLCMFDRSPATIE
jgi:hypothetical protein